MTPEQFHARIWDILEPIDGDVFHVVAAPAPDDAAVAAVEARAGFAMPAEILAFSKRTNGLCLQAREEVWPQAKLYSVGPAWTFWRGLIFLGIDTPDLPEWARISTAQQQLADAGVTGVLPLLKIMGDGGRIWGMSAEGKTVLVMDDDVSELEGDFCDLYAEQLLELMQRQRDMAAKLGK
ncbi:hypothetical protein [Comamonas composti]|uniref:hypothetical protein n=1 Tax=Comamonas composti TaxID=408558 RepID=UPI000426A577|nr:hypothetical protein [Comamonas composti]